MKTVFGVYSATPLNKKLKNGYTMHDWVMRQNGYPAFCLRSLTGDHAITVEEIDFLRQKDCRIGLIIRDLTEAQVSRTNGAEDGRRAAEAAKALGVPQHRGIAICVEIKPEWSVNHNWMIGFAYALSSAGYCPGFIGNTDSSKNFNFDRQCSHYVQATADTNGFGAVYGATEPKAESAPESWEPYCPSALNPEDIGLWVCGTTTFDALTLDNVYARDEKVLANMW